jgi:DHA1 family inner membrane transport protein
MDKIKQAHAPSAFWILLALAICSFCIGTTEFVMAGVLPDIAASLSISIPMAGWLMSGYAMGVFLSAPIITAATIRFPRKYTLLALMSLFIIGNVISAIAPSYGILMLGRIIAALCHGAFFGISSVVAAEAVSPNKRARAIALMFTGLGRELAMFKRPKLWLALAVTATSFGGVFAMFAYIAPIMINVTGFAESNMIEILFLFGVGLVLGNIIGGKAADHELLPALFTFLIILAIALFSFVYLAHFKIPAVITLFIVGFVGFAIVSPVQAQVMHETKDAPTLASAANISAFNVGIAAGTYFGGLTIHLGFGFTSASWVGGILVLSALLIQIVIVQRRSR